MNAVDRRDGAIVQEDLPTEAKLKEKRIHLYRKTVRVKNRSILTNNFY